MALADTIYQNTGKRLGAELGVLEAKNPWPMQSGQKRPSVRFIWGAGKGKGDAKCIPYHSLEVTIYAKIGAHTAKSPSMALLVQSGGPGQRGQNGCTYNLGFGADGIPISGEECQHDPKVKGGKIKNSITGVNIGPLENKTIGIKWILFHPKPNLVHLEGWVDQKNDGQWKIFYSGDNPHGGSGIPIITKVPMFGSDTCQEARLRCDGYWPVEIVKEKTFVAELYDDPKTTGLVKDVPIPKLEEEQQEDLKLSLTPQTAEEDEPIENFGLEPAIEENPQ